MYPINTITYVDAAYCAVPRLAGMTCMQMMEAMQYHYMNSHSSRPDTMATYV